MNKKIISIVMALVLTMGLLISCRFTGNATYESTASTDEKESASREDEYLKKITPFAYSDASSLALDKGAYIAVIGKGAKNDYWEAVKAGVDKAAEAINKNNGYTGNDKIKVVYSAPDTEGDVDQQINILDEELARYPIAVGISVVDYQAYQVQFDLASENDIPIITFDSGSTYPGIMARVGTDNNKASQQAASEMTDRLDNGGKILILAGDSKAESDIDRVKGFTDTISKNDKGITIADTVYMDQQKETPAEIIAKYPDITGIYITSGTLLSSMSDYFASDKSGDLTIISHDGGEGQEELNALEDGSIDGLIVQNPYGMGYATVIASARAALQMGNEAVVDTGFTWITKDDLKNYKDGLYAR